MPVIGPEQPVTIEGVTRLPPEWGIYQDLIEGIPEDIGVRAACVGPHWTYVDAECGLGIALTCPGGTGPETAADPSRLSLTSTARFIGEMELNGGTINVINPENPVYSPSAV